MINRSLAIEMHQNMCEIRSNLTINIQQQSYRSCCGAFVVNYEQISHFILVFLSLTLNK